MGWFRGKSWEDSSSTTRPHAASVEKKKKKNVFIFFVHTIFFHRKENMSPCEYGTQSHCPALVRGDLLPRKYNKRDIEST